jgi:hypothetical protein
MSWEMINHIATWACAFSALACAIVILLHLRFQRHMQTVLMANLNGLGETYRLGLDVLTIDMDRLKARVAELERK